MVKTRTKDKSFWNQKNTTSIEWYRLSISKKAWSTKKCTCKCKIRKRLFEKALKKIAKIQNLLQNEFNQIGVMRGLSRDELEKIAK